MRQSRLPKTRKASVADTTRASSGRDRNLRIILTVILIISVGSLLGVVSFTVYRMNNLENDAGKVISYTEFNSSVTVAYSSAGLNGDTDALKFGKISQGGGGTRFIIINTTAKSVVQIYFSGNISRFLGVEKNNYILEAGTVEKVPITIDIPKDATNGDYEGTVHVVLLRP